MSTVHYSAAFVENVKRRFPSSADLHAALDKGESSETLDLLHRDIKAAIDALPYPPKLEDMRAIGHLEKLWQNEMTAHYAKQG